jgi:hypothetical protein
MKKDPDLFFRYVNRQSGAGCWVWTGSINGCGHCQLNWGGKVTRPQYVSLEIAGLPRTDGEFVRPTCGNSRCVAPHHLEKYRPKAVEERFWSKVAPPNENGCMIWQASKNKCGYGSFRVERGYPEAAHRVSYRLLKGEIPSGLVVMHACDVPACVNPDHLLLGTPQDNTADRDKKGRQARGERSASARLTSADVLEIRRQAKLGVSYSVLAKQYDVANATIQQAAVGRRWKHLPI